MSKAEQPVYLKLREKIGAAILDGRYGDGDPLPSVRAFAAEEGANPLTVAKAYQTFQDDGIVIVRRGVGMFVANGASEKLRTRERETFLNDEWPEIQRRIDRLGLDAAELLDRELA
ncbi:GntR family transcriptional regulator [Parasphingopyxis marina]|uniref:GntR family transcriptional regulator n=1 Tax=Parasphingopyxis marina TaxID=2761622 RepID=A0A842I107_9SPHN|nr:GntR family transcriptional regulator [Parasphingopyxis marina]MBC2778373.1 GntR family transcriptional regulator [Parasphingopyxis marina]